MEHAALVRGRQPRAELPSDLDSLVGRQASDAPQQRREIFAVDVLHREKMTAVRDADVVHAADVRMRHLPRRPDLAVEARQTRRVHLERLGQKLQRDRLLEPQVVGTVHLAHASLPEQVDHAIPFVEDGARRESAVPDGGA